MSSKRELTGRKPKGRVKTEVAGRETIGPRRGDTLDEFGPKKKNRLMIRIAAKNRRERKLAS